MNITIIGTGYVGLVSGACFAEHGHTVTCVDVDAQKIAKLNQGQSPIYEVGLEELIHRNTQAKRLFFTTDLASSASISELISIAVGTPSAEDGSVDLTYVKQAAENIGKILAKTPKNKRLTHYVIATKSTVPIGTGDVITEIIKQHFDGNFSAVSNPEFLREGQAINDFLNPDRIVVGSDSKEAENTMAQLYHSFTCPILYTNRITAEMIKYAANSFLATSISFINSLSQLCEEVGADITKVSEGLRLDKRIGRHAFVTAGPAWGGSCFPKDVRGLVHFAQEKNVRLPIVESALEANASQRHFVVEKIKKTLKNLDNKKLAIWGLSFKAHTDDVRESPSLGIIESLLEHGAQIHAYDPVAEQNAKKIIPQIQYAPNPYETVKNADAIVLLTDWPEFRSLDWQKAKKAMKQALIFDMRNMLEPDFLTGQGFSYIGLGR